MTDPFIAQLADLARTQRTANKWILVPTHSIGWTLAERLLKEGCDWVNLRFTTPLHEMEKVNIPDSSANGTRFTAIWTSPCPREIHDFP